jgi:hypothetical protein
MIKNEISHSEFNEIAKQSYVSVAYSDFAIPNRKKTFSRAAVLTGLSRKEVVRLMKGEESNLSPPKVRINRAARVVTGWLSDTDFTDTAGKPRILPLRSEYAKQPGELSFASLVERYSGDITARAILDELTRLNIASIKDNHHVRLEKDGYLPEMSDAESIDILFTCAGNLLKTGVFNITESKQKEKQYQRQLTHFNVPESLKEEFKVYSEKRSQELLLEFDQWIASKRSANTPKSNQNTSSIGIGIYYFEDNDQQE